MKTNFSIFSFVLLFSSPLFAQYEGINIQPWEKVFHQDNNSGSAYLQSLSRDNAEEYGILPFDEGLKPFYHGVASGDPLSDRVIIWTRYTPDNEAGVNVTWQMATDPEMNNVIQTGDFFTNEGRDFTVKVDVVNLAPNTTYYYNFSANGYTSITGRTRTAPTATSDQSHLRFAVGSCSHYAHGYFNAYSRIADRNDLSAVIHLGDYIYEYGNEGFAALDSIRTNEPEHEIITLADYRTRHSLYKLDRDLRRAHQQHPFITVWDDHEVANDAWQNGAQNHDEATEGSYADRKDAAQQAYFEWLPIREAEGDNPYLVRRTIHYGDLVDLIMIDTRHEGREQQAPLTDPIVSDPNRTILGAVQYEWLRNELINSTAKWTVLGNQIVFSTINTMNLLGNDDMWDGYPAERLKVVDVVTNSNIRNFVVLTGDIHVGIGNDIITSPTGYDPATGVPAVGVEFVTPSISSANDEALTGLPLPIEQVTAVALGLNPHAKYLNLKDHGYYVLDVTEDRIQADWFLGPKTAPATTESFDKGLYADDQVAHLLSATEPSAAISNPPSPAPEYTAIGSVTPPTAGLAVLGVYPNPIVNIGVLHYAVDKTQPLTITIFDETGKQLQTLFNAQQQVGIYSLKFNASQLPSGAYFCQFKTPMGAVSKKIIVAK